MATDKTTHIAGWYNVSAAIVGGIIGVIGATTAAKMTAPKHPADQSVAAVPADQSVAAVPAKQSVTTVSAKYRPLSAVGISALGTPTVKVFSVEPIFGVLERAKSKMPAVFDQSFYKLTLTNPSKQDYLGLLWFIVTAKRTVNFTPGAELVRAQIPKDGVVYCNLHEHLGDRIMIPEGLDISAEEISEIDIVFHDDYNQQELEKNTMLVVEGYFQCDYFGGVAISPILEIKLLERLLRPGELEVAKPQTVEFPLPADSPPIGFSTPPPVTAAPKKEEPR
jgi:hypothetical protein